MTLFVGIGNFRRERWMSPKQLAEYNRNKREYEQKYREKERQLEMIRSDVMVKKGIKK